MSKNSEAIKRRKSESSEFKQPFEEEQAKLDFADLLFELREQTGLNQTAFAKKVKKITLDHCADRKRQNGTVILPARRYCASFGETHRN